MTYRAKKQKGVALLLALGFLSLLLVMGIAFVTNATVARKSAANSRARAQARTLAQSAVNRLLTEIRYILKHPGDNYVAPANLTSAETAAGLFSSEDDTYLLQSEKSPLACYVYGEKYIPKNIYQNEKLLPKWEFWFSQYENDGSPKSDAVIIGRTAFMALSASASVNLSEVLRGAPFSPETGSWSRWDARRGASMRELYSSDFDRAALYNRFKDERFEDKVTKQDYATSAKQDDYPDYDAIFTAANLTDETDPESTYRNRIRSWLLPGGYNDPEIFAFNSDETTRNMYNDKTDFFHRFNLARRTADDLSVWDSAAGDARVTVAALLGNPRKFSAKEMHPEPSTALPWLKCIKGDDAAHDETYTVEVLRKQVAANLIDYSDEDLEATSDSTDWATTAPTYTGNDKTPYINEVMIGITATTTRTDTRQTAGTPPVTSYSASYATDLAPRNLTVELVNIYAKHPEGGGFDKSVTLSLAGTAVLKVTPYEGATAKTVTMQFDTGEQDVTALLTKNGNYAYATLTHVGHFKLYDGEGTTGTELTSLPTVEASLPGEDTKLEPKVELTKLTLDRIYLLYAGSRADYVRKLEQTEKLEAKNEVEPAAFGSDNTRETESTVNLFAGFEVDDPRMNLYQKTGSVVHWFELRHVDNAAGLDLTAIHGADDAEDVTKFSIGAKNNKCDPTPDPAVMKTDAEPFGSHPDGALLSTAYIKNKPMEALAELGVIHRGEKWRTINLKCCAARIWDGDYDPQRSSNEAEGYTYTEGDAAILDQVKLTQENFTAGKVNLNRYPTTGSNSLFKALFENIGFGVTRPDHYKPADVGSRVSASDAETLRDVLGGTTTRIGANQTLLSRGHMVDFLKGQSQFIQGDTDVKKEIIPAASAGLTSTYVSNPDILQFVIVAQSIQDVGTAAGVSITKLKTDGSDVTLEAKQGKFDCEKDSDYKAADPKYVYFDEITGEVKLLVTVQINEALKTVKLLKTEFLD